MFGELAGLQSIFISAIVEQGFASRGPIRVEFDTVRGRPGAIDASMR